MIKKIILGTLILVLSYLVYATPFQEKPVNREARTQEIFRQIVKATGEGNRIRVLHIIDAKRADNSDIMNAWALPTGDVFMTKAEMKFDYEHGGEDAIALVLAHEVAHITLGHVHIPSDIRTKDIMQTLEAQADKMGAFYMMRAGYNLCAGRESWKALEELYGDVLIQDHPDFAYRFAQLNINCRE